MKHLKKDDGYVLIYVLIVFTILALVAGSICTVALNNLKAQKADVARMEARYAAEGELQKFVAEVEALNIPVNGTEPDDNEETVTAAAKAVFWNEVRALGTENLSVERIEDTNKIQITAESKEAGYSAAISAEAELTIDTDFDAVELKAACFIAENGWKYTAYDISYEEVAG